MIFVFLFLTYFTLTVSRSLQFSYPMRGCKRHRFLCLDLHTSQMKVHKKAPKQASLVVQW